MRTILFNSTEIGRSSFSSLGFKRGLAPLNSDGWVLMGQAGFGHEQAGLGHEQEKKTSGILERFTMEASLSVGYQWSVGRTHITLLTGPAWEREDELFTDMEGSKSQTRLGMRVQAELWYRPTDDLFMTATLVAKTTRGDTWSRIAAGYRFLGAVSIGPEVTLYRDPNYLEWRAGAHITDLRVFGTTLRVSGGWQETDRHGGPYVTVAGYRPF